MPIMQITKLFCSILLICLTHNVYGSSPLIVNSAAEEVARQRGRVLRQQLGCFFSELAAASRSQDGPRILALMSVNLSRLYGDKFWLTEDGEIVGGRRIDSFWVHSYILNNLDEGLSVDLVDEVPVDGARMIQVVTRHDGPLLKYNSIWYFVVEGDRLALIDSPIFPAPKAFRRFSVRWPMKEI